MTGSAGISVDTGSPTLEGNVIEDNTLGGLVLGVTATPVLTGNTICGNGTNIQLPEGATPPSLVGNEVCPDAAPEESPTP